MQDKKKKGSGEKENILGDKYSQEQQVYIEQQNIYPKIDID